jgi:hypothetical protein
MLVNTNIIGSKMDENGQKESFATIFNKGFPGPFANLSEKYGTVSFSLHGSMFNA